jgi:hypothetical protein
MSEPGSAVRLRQAVLVAHELEPLAATIRSALGLDEPFRDPGVAEFGLVNVVFAIGDCFLEIISPTGPDTAAGRHLQRTGGDGGYMALFDLEDLASARARAEQNGVRVVWQIDLPDISGTHLHPQDVRGAIVSFDTPAAPASWRWGGPRWIDGQPADVRPNPRLAGLVVRVVDVEASARTWAGVLDAPLGELGIRFEPAAGAADEGIAVVELTEFAYEATICGVTFRPHPPD